MFDSQNQSRRATAYKALVALIGATGCLAAVAYAASGPHIKVHGGRPHKTSVGGPAVPVETPPERSGHRPPRPRIVGSPAATTISTSVRIRYVDALAPVAFQCMLDGAGWKRCGTRVAYSGLAVGPHRFLVRAEAPGGGRSWPARLEWAQAEPADFSIEPDLSVLSALYPGAAPVALPLTVVNPNSSPIVVTALRVSVTADAPGCASAENLQLFQSSASSSAPLAIPANSSARVPAPGVTAPAIAMRDLGVDQDACQGARFPLAFSGEAHG
jgi:hypothetical protein